MAKKKTFIEFKDVVITNLQPEYFQMQNTQNIL